MSETKRKIMEMTIFDRITKSAMRAFCDSFKYGHLCKYSALKI